ncbi:hypothetical protein F5Y17DRAFT_460236 [Xylariaceae sp. FL0594]|nr:hypothetical protein F5Y17DRAFT_460236 [Xylariaceae sp. FL0594]
MIPPLLGGTALGPGVKMPLIGAAAQTKHAQTRETDIPNKMQYVEDVFGPSNAIYVPNATRGHPEDFPETVEDFYDYPKQMGWEVRANYTLTKNTSSVVTENLEWILQRWLYFGLIYTVVRDTDGPIIRYE